VFLIPVTLAPVALGFLGPVYLALSLAAGAWFARAALRLVRRRTDASARALFRTSLVHLFVVFLGMITDLALRV
jgi:protoheme IX farnesyltransferase